jgi:hypothetical protein
MHPCRSYTLREGYWLVFYSERMAKMWMMSSVGGKGGGTRNRSLQNEACVVYSGGRKCQKGDSGTKHSAPTLVWRPT